MSSSFDLFGDPTIRATVSARNGASELYLIDRSFNEVARGVGRLELDLVPGPYRVRERVGDTETVSEVFEVGTGKRCDFTVHGVAYESPLPIAGTATYQDLPPLERRRGSGIRIVVRDPRAADPPEPGGDDGALMKEVGRLRVETLVSEPVARLAQGRILACGNGVFAVDLDVGPGSYALVQDCAGSRQCCMVLYVMPEWNPALYLLVPRPAGPGMESAGLRLADAALCYTARDARDPPGDIELARLEAARHALSRGRPIGGWARLPDAQGKPAFNPLLALIDAYLLLPRPPVDKGGDIVALIDEAAAAFGDDFPDVQAVRIARRQVPGERAGGNAASGEEKPAGQPDGLMDDSLIGPPILNRSWRHLLGAYDDRKGGPILPFEFSVEPSESWFVWSESTGARAPARNGSPRDGMLGKATSAELLQLAREVFERVARSDESADWVRKVQQLAAEQVHRADSVFRDPAMQRIVAALAMVSDPILQKAFGQEELVRRAWASLKVPTEVLNATLRKLAGALAENKLLAGLSMVIGMAALAKVVLWLRSPGDDGTTQ